MQLRCLFALLPLLPLAIGYQHARPRHPHPAQLQHEEREVVILDERGMPITTTTTMWHFVTKTETVWVAPTDQAGFIVPNPPSASLTTTSADETHSASVTASSSSTHSDSASPTSTAAVESVTPSPSSSEHESAASTTSTHGLHMPGSMYDPNASASSSSDSSSAASSLASETATTTSSWDWGPYVPYSRSSGSGAPQQTVAPSESHSSVVSSSSSSSDSSVATEAVSSSTTAPISHDHSSTATTTAQHSEPTTVHSSSETTTAHSSSSETSSSTSSSSSVTTTSSSSAHITSASSSTSSSVTAEAIPSPSASPSAAPSAGSNGLHPLPSRIMAGYYPDWSGWYLSPENIDFSRFDILDFAFALPTASGGLEFTQWDSSDLLHRLSNLAHAAGKRVKLSIGGWTGSKYFSPIAADAGLRATFVQSMVDAYHTYNLDGIDIDWEYPGAGGASGNAVSPQDSANFLLMLQQLRAALPTGAIITLATQVWPFAGPNGSPLSDVSGFAAVIDWILIMNYDIWGSSSNPGPNAPLSDACGTSTQPLANAYASVSSWTQAGLPAHQITLGVPAYGYLQQSWANSLRTRSTPEDDDLAGNATETFGRSMERHRRGMEKRAVTLNSGWSTTEGQIMWHDLVSQGALTQQQNGQWVGAGGFVRNWDQCSSTPWLKSSASSQIVTYDDPDSMSMKGQFAAQAGLRGCNVFSIDGDWTNGGWPLTDAVRSGMGL